MAAKQKHTTQARERAEYPFLLPPSVGSADPTPLLATLARVAVAVARQRSEALRRDDNSKQIDESSYWSKVIMYTLSDETVMLQCY